MTTPATIKAKFKPGFLSGKRRNIRINPRELITRAYFEGGSGLPLVIRPNADQLSLHAWASSHADFIESELLRHGAILFRGFDVSSVDRFEQVARSMFGELLDYNERAAPRVEVNKGVFTSTEFPSDQVIQMHHEMSYSHNWPLKLLFCCIQPAERGGRTPIADDRKVFQMIDPRLKETFLRKHVMYVRNYGRGIDLPWQEVFRTSDRSVVERYCRTSHMQFEWIGEDWLRTRAIRPCVATHTQTGETVWFNHAHVFHISALEPAVRNALQDGLKEDELPRNVFYGDGSRIETSVLDEIRETYKQATVSFPWEKGDVILLDNILVSHGRESFLGPRKILFAMSDLFTGEPVSAA